MADHNSVQYAKYEGTEGVHVNEWGGRVRVLYFKLEAATLAQNDRYKLGNLPPGARVIGGYLAHGAYGASVTADIGTATDEDKYAAALDVAAAGTKEYANTAALNYGEEVGADGEVVYLKLEGANPADDQESRGHILYVVD